MSYSSTSCNSSIKIERPTALSRLTTPTSSKRKSTNPSEAEKPKKKKKKDDSTTPTKKDDNSTSTKKDDNTTPTVEMIDKIEVVPVVPSPTPTQEKEKPPQPLAPKITLPIRLASAPKSAAPSPKIPLENPTPAKPIDETHLSPKSVEVIGEKYEEVRVDDKSDKERRRQARRERRLEKRRRKEARSKSNSDKLKQNAEKEGEESVAFFVSPVETFQEGVGEEEQEANPDNQLDLVPYQRRTGPSTPLVSSIKCPAEKTVVPPPFFEPITQLPPTSSSSSHVNPLPEDPSSHRYKIRKLIEERVPDINVDYLFSGGDFGEGEEENEEETIPAASSRFSGKERAKVINEWMKEVPDNYSRSLKDSDKGYIGPIKAELANSMIRLDKLSKLLKKWRAENKAHRQLAITCEDYVTSQLETQELHHRDAMKAMQKELTAAKDAQNEAQIHATSLIQEKKELEAEVQRLRESHAIAIKEKDDNILDLQSQLSSCKGDVQFWKDKSSEIVTDVETGMKRTVAEAWELVIPDYPFSYFDEYITYVEKKTMALFKGTTPPPLPNPDTFGTATTSTVQVQDEAPPVEAEKEVDTSLRLGEVAEGDGEQNDSDEDSDPSSNDSSESNSSSSSGGSK